MPPNAQKRHEFNINPIERYKLSNHTNLMPKNVLKMRLSIFQANLNL